jgi:hypothetical protein
VPQVIARLEITQDDQGLIEVNGTGPLLKNIAFAYGLLERAKDIIRVGKTTGVTAATLSDLPGHRM